MCGTSVAVTGGTGFVGSHLVEKLVGLGARVTVISRTANLRNLAGVSGDVKLVRTDLCDIRGVVKVLAEVECVFHLAALVPEGDSDSPPADSVNNNVLVTANLCEAARAAGSVRKMVYASTRQVYGKPRRLPVDEEHPTNPETFYAAGKLAGEHFVQVLAHRHGISATILRYSGVYGPREENLNGTVPRFIALAVEGKPIQIQGSGEQVRNYTYVQDVVEATVLASSFIPGVTVYNVGGANVSIRKLGECVLSAAGRGAELQFLPSKAEQYDYTVDSSKIEFGLGFKAETPLEAGIKKEMEWYSNLKRTER